MWVFRKESADILPMSQNLSEFSTCWSVFTKHFKHDFICALDSFIRQEAGVFDRESTFSYSLTEEESASFFLYDLGRVVSLLFAFKLFFEVIFFQLLSCLWCAMVDWRSVFSVSTVTKEHPMFHQLWQINFWLLSGLSCLFLRSFVVTAPHLPAAWICIRRFFGYLVAMEKNDG